MIKEASVGHKQKIIGLSRTLLMLWGSVHQLFAQLPPAKMIPNFTFYTLNDQPFAQNQLKKKGKVLFLFFDATCTHCQYETQLISSHYKDFKNTSFYLVSMDKKQQVKDFVNTYGKQLGDKNNVTVLLDRDRQFLQKFMPSQFPALYVYGNDKKLLKYWDTPVNIDQLLGVIYAP